MNTIKFFFAAVASCTPPALAAPEKSLRGPDPARDEEAGALRAVRAGDRPGSDGGPRARRLQQEPSDEYAGFCRDVNGNQYESIKYFPDGADDSDVCLASCPASDQFVGYERMPGFWHYFGRMPASCYCLYEPGFVGPLVDGDNCPGDYGLCSVPRGDWPYNPPSPWWEGPSGRGPVDHGDGGFVTCHTRFADDDALEWAERAAENAAEAFAATDAAVEEAEAAWAAAMEDLDAAEAAAAEAAENALSEDRSYQLVLEMVGRGVSSALQHLDEFRDRARAAEAAAAAAEAAVVEARAAIRDPAMWATARESAMWWTARESAYELVALNAVVAGFAVANHQKLFDYAANHRATLGN